MAGRRPVQRPDALVHNGSMNLEINSLEVSSPPAPSASVVLLRDGPHGLQVLLLKRHGNSRVLGGIHVFPGGKLDRADCTVAADRLDQPAEALHLALAEPGLDAATACGLHVAALRETFEESGLLLGLTAPASRLAELRQKVQSGAGFLEATGELGLHRLATRTLHPWSRWITPRMPSVSDRRFDTRFFVAAAPAGQDVEVDAHEVTEGTWLEPAEALRRYWEGRLGLVPVQIMTLVQLAPHRTVQSAIDRARSERPALIEPEPFDQEGCRVICYPGDPRHPVVSPAWHGPTRLTWRNQRFEPEGGLEAFFPGAVRRA